MCLDHLLGPGACPTRASWILKSKGVQGVARVLCITGHRVRPRFWFAPTALSLFWPLCSQTPSNRNARAGPNASPPGRYNQSRPVWGGGTTSPLYGNMNTWHTFPNTFFPNPRHAPNTKTKKQGVATHPTHDHFPGSQKPRVLCRGEAGLEEASLDEAGLQKAGLEEAGLEEAGLEEAILEEAGLVDARRRLPRD